MNNYQLQELLDDNKKQIPDKLYLEISNILMNRNKEEKSDYTLNELKAQTTILKRKMKILKHKQRIARRNARNERLGNTYVMEFSSMILGTFCCVMYIIMYQIL